MSIFPDAATLGRNPMNPYVLNEHYFANVTDFLYENSWTDIAHKVNNLSAFIVGLLLALLVFYLIFQQTPKAFQPYSRMLILSSSVDIIFLLGDFWCQSVSGCF